MTNGKASKYRKPVATPAQIAIFLIIVIWNILTNSYLFIGLDAVINMCISFGVYFFILTMRGKLGDGNELIQTVVGILTSTESAEVKTSRLESVLVFVTRELGDLYEEELGKLKTYIMEKNGNK